jgi:hypothetical protein
MEKAAVVHHEAARDLQGFECPSGDIQNVGMRHKDILL